MTREEVKQLIWQEISRSLNTLLTGVSANADGAAVEDITNFLPGSTTYAQRPVAFPFGFNARTPDGVSQLIAQVGNHPLNRAVLGHFDLNRPPLQSGEVTLYNNFGQQVYLKEGQILIGSPSADEPVPLGNVLQTFLENFLNYVISHTHSGNLGYPTSAPIPPESLRLQEILQSPIQDGKVLSKESFVEENPGGS